MACHSAIEKKGVSLSADKTVKEALAALKKGKVSMGAVVDEKGHLLGLFSSGILLKNLIPVPITTSSGVQIDMKISAVPGVAKRFAKTMSLHIGDVMERKTVKVLPDEPLWEVVGRMNMYGEPLCVVDDKGRFMGLVTYASLVEELKNSLKTGD